MLLQTGKFSTFSPLRMISEATKELNVAWATNEGRRLPAHWKSAHRVIASIKRTGKKTGSRCARANNMEDASAEETKIVLLRDLLECCVPTERVEIRAPNR